MKTTRTLQLSSFALEALSRGGVDGGLDVQLTMALRFYLGAESSVGLAWPYPDFLRGSESSAEPVTVTLEVDDALWEAFEGEAERQGVSAGALAGHAAMFLAAELEAGRVTQRILEDLAQAERGLGAASPPAGTRPEPRRARSRLACSERRPRWWRPCTELSVFSSAAAISVGERPTMWRRTSTSRWSSGSASSASRRARPRSMPVSAPTGVGDPHLGSPGSRAGRAGGRVRRCARRAGSRRRRARRAARTSRSRVISLAKTFWVMSSAS